MTDPSTQSPVKLGTLLAQLFQYISPRRRFQFGLMIILTLITSVAEVVSLGAVVPFIGILTEPERVFNLPILSGYIHWMGIGTPGELVFPLAVAFSVAAIIAAGLRLLLLWVSIRLSNVTGADLSTEVYRRTLYQPYRVHVARSSSEIISGITQKVASATSVLTSLITVITTAVLFLAILFTMFFIDPYVASIAMICFGIGYVLIAWKTRMRLRRNSQCIAQQQTQVVKTLQEGLGAIRDVLLDGTQFVYTNIYKNSIHQLQKATGENQYIQLGPRYVMEALGMVLVAVFAYSLSKQPGGIGAALPILGALALGAQRLMPLLQQLYGNWSVVAGSQMALNDVVKLLQQPLPEDAFTALPEPLEFTEAIRFDNVSFRYASEGPWILDGVDLTIPNGARIGFVGSTGSGKSTALDLLMSLLEPNQGRILVDGKTVDGEHRRAWQRTIAHVPQNIFLADATIAENIAFGVPHEQIDYESVRLAARQAHIAEFIEASPKGYNVIVGERGVRLSGGQRQRIGIARALYKKATVLVFDEATSALDSETESAVMQAIENLGGELTVLIIAHRITTLRGCDTVYQLDKGKVVSSDTYKELIAENQQ